MDSLQHNPLSSVENLCRSSSLDQTQNFSTSSSYQTLASYHRTGHLSSQPSDSTDRNYPPPPPPPGAIDSSDTQNPNPPPSENQSSSDLNDQGNSNHVIQTNSNSMPSLGRTQSSNDKDYSGGEEETSSRRKRRSRWDPPSESDNQNNGDSGTRKRKSRWADDEPKAIVQLPDFMKEFTGAMDPELQALNIRLLEISRMLSSGLPLDDRPEGARSPSPEPIYDNMGIRINTREYRARERLTKERLDIITQLVKKNPNFKPPADYRPPKLQKKLYIPMKECPGYNFIGLIIGPRGNTQKRMEKETGAKIVIRGKGSLKEGRLQQKKDLRPDPSENEDLHVLVEAETQEALDAAAGMVEKLLQPVDEVLNEHKRQQLRELAALNGTIRDEEFCRLCGEQGHRQYACPSRTSTFKSDVLCKICGDGGHPTIDCPVKGTTGKKMDDEYQNFLAELGGTAPDSLTKQNSTLSILGSNVTGRNPPWANGNAGGAIGSSAQVGLTSMGAKIGKDYDETNLYIGNLPPNFDDDSLIQLFSSFGNIVMAKVIKDRVTGLSKGYGFVKYADISQASQAIATMNGHCLEGRVIAVRVAGKPPQPAVPLGPPAPPMPFSSNATGSGGYPSQQFTAGGPPGSAPMTGYMSAPVPWGPPVPPPYAHYPPPPPGSSTYTYVQGQSVPSYAAQYPPQPQSNPPVALPSNAPSNEAQQNLPSSVESQNNGNSLYAMPPNGQPTCPSSSFGYSSYYSVPSVSHSAADHSQCIGIAPWVSNQPAPPTDSSSEQTNYGTQSEYEKFMAEMK